MTTSHASSAPRDAHTSWQDLDDALHSIVELSREGLAKAPFYDAFLQRCCTVLQCRLPSIWQLDADGIWIRQHDSAADDERPRLSSERIRSIADGRLPLVVFETATETNPSPQHAALVCPILLDGSVTSVVEMWKTSSDSSESLERDLQFLEAACEMAGDYHRHQELRRLQQSELRWQELSPFVDRAHASLDPTTVCFTLANEGRRFLGCDRVSIVLYQAGKFRLTAVSGQDTIDRRANAVRHLEKLATEVYREQSELWWSAAADSPAADASQAFLSETQCELLAVVPLHLTGDTSAASELAPGAGAILVVEQFHSRQTVAQLKTPLRAIQAPSARALSNALRHHQQPFYRVTSQLRPFLTPAGRGRFSKRLLALTAFLFAAAAICLIPIDLTISADGRLRPAHRQHVFAQANGVVRELKTSHGTQVTKGDVLATLSSSEMDFEIAEVLGALQTADKRLATIRSARLAMSPSNTDARREYNRLTAEEEATKSEIAGLKSQQSILDKRKKALMIQSPLSGTVLTWDVAHNLEARPVQRGEILMTVAQLNGNWIVELDVPDDRIGYICQAEADRKSALPVDLVLATDPTTTYKATMRSIALRSEPDHQGDPTVRIVATLNQQTRSGLRPGAMVVARIHCGPRPLGFVWFHDLVEVIRTRVLF